MQRIRYEKIRNTKKVTLGGEEMKLTREEKETIIRWDMSNDTATIYTFDPALKRKLAKLYGEYPDTVSPERPECEWGSVEYYIPKQLITIRSPRKKKELTQSQLTAMKKNLAKGRNK